MSPSSSFFLRTLFFFDPWRLGDPENWIPANAMKSPVHIQPEWYFLPAYAILRSVPTKLGGVICLLASVLILLLLTISLSWEKKNDLLSKVSLSVFFVSFLSLAWLGGCGVEAPYLGLSQAYSALYFLSFSFFFLL